MVLPVVLAMTFGALRIKSELDAASELSIASGNVAIVDPAVEFVHRVDALAVAAASGAGVPEAIAKFDADARTFSASIESGRFDAAIAAQLANAASTGRVLRDEVAAGSVPHVRLAERAETVTKAVSEGLSTIVGAVDDNAVRGAAEGLSAALAAHSSLVTQRILAAAPGFDDTSSLQIKAAAAVGAEVAALTQLARHAPAPDVNPLQAAAQMRREAYTRPGDSAYVGSLHVSDERYLALTARSSAGLGETIAAQANAMRAAALRDTAIILGAVLVALVVALGVGRSLVRSISLVRHGALQVARRKLPEEISRLSSGESVPEITALPVYTSEEVGQLARAVDDIHFQAVRLAGEHGTRLQIGEMFETLSRRSKSLVEEQLALIEMLEQDEQDPLRLDHLFRLDHLATRMRRNGDNLLVLADTVERHLRLEPVPLDVVLRAAMSEVEDYQRVKLGPIVAGALTGASASDIGHLVAELIDNALRFSPPHSAVTVTVARAVDAGLLIEVSDRGLGIAPEDLRAANDSLAMGGEVTADTTKRMGLFVVGRLARRHNATVRLRATAALTDEPGVTASVHLPGALIAPLPEPEQIEPERQAPALTLVPPAPPSHPIPIVNGHNGNGVHEAIINGSDGTGLPKRSPGASGFARFTVVEPAEPPAEAQPEPVAARTAPTSNAFAFFNASPDKVRAEAAVADTAPIFEAMTSEWLMDPTSHGDRDGNWSTPADQGWAAAAHASDAPVDSRTTVGLPIRDPGKRLVPGHARFGADGPATRSAPVSRDPLEVRDLLRRQLAGVRDGRSHESRHSLEGDR